MVIGARQLGLAILMHDAAHGLLFANRRLNEWVGAWLCAAPVFTSLALYRPYHLHAPSPHAAGRGSRSRPVGAVPDHRAEPVAQDRAATSPGRTAYQRRLEQFRARRSAKEMAVVRRPTWCCSAALAAAGYWWLYPVLWLLPLATWYQLVSRIRNIAEHAVVPDNDDPLRNTRTTRANWLERLFVAPYWVNYHLEHHLFMFVPCWRLPAAHRALLAAGLGERMEIQPGYARRAAARDVTPSDEPRARTRPARRPAHLTPANEKGGPRGPPSRSCRAVRRHCAGQGWMFMSGPRSYGGGTCASVVTLAIERPFEGAQAARAELLVDRRLLRRAIGELGDHDVDVEALAARRAAAARARWSTSSPVYLPRKLAYWPFVGAAAAGVLALQRRHAHLLLQHAGADGREIGLVVADGADAARRAATAATAACSRPPAASWRAPPSWRYRTGSRPGPGRLPPVLPPA